MPYAANNKISKTPIDGGIEITQEQYDAARAAMIAGRKIEVREGSLVILSAETRAVYSTQDGAENIIPDNALTPEGFTDDPRPTEQHEWDEGWILNQESFEEYIIENLKAHRDATLSAQTVTLSNGAELRVDERTRRDTNDIFTGMNNANMTSYDGWNAANGVYTMTLADFQEYSVLALQEAAKTFTAYNAAKSELESNSFDSLEAAIDYFNNEYGGL